MSLVPPAPFTAIKRGIRLIRTGSFDRHPQVNHETLVFAMA